MMMINKKYIVQIQLYLEAKYGKEQHRTVSALLTTAIENMVTGGKSNQKKHIECET